MAIAHDTDEKNATFDQPVTIFRHCRKEIYGDLWGCGLGPMGFVEVYGLRCGTYGAQAVHMSSIGPMGTYGVAVWDLWDS